MSDILKVRGSASDPWESIPALVGPGVPSGGADGQTLVKKSNADYDTEWRSLMDVLYDGVKIGVVGATITLSNSIRNYDLLIITWNTNIDRYTQVIDTAQITVNSGNHFACYAATDLVSSSSALQAVAAVYFPSETTIAISVNKYNNSNWTLGIMRVVGLRLH